MDAEKRVIALGFFDGLHLGHRALLEKTAERARALDCTPSVISFDTHPSRTVTGGAVELIHSPLDRSALLRERFGIEDQIFLHFDETLMRMPWDRFVEWLARDWQAVHLVAGYDFRFGYRGAGNADLLRDKCAALGLGCDVIPQVTLDGVPVNSTYIRELLRDGRIETANRFLGYRHFFTGIVRDGFRLGRTMGVPTVNMRLAEGVLTPARGVYVTEVTLPDGRVFPGVTNIGVRPTVGGSDRISVETHLLGFSGNLYGRLLRVAFYTRLREERKFDGMDALKAQIHADIAAAEAYFAAAGHETEVLP